MNENVAKVYEQFKKVEKEINNLMMIMEETEYECTNSMLVLFKNVNNVEDLSYNLGCAIEDEFSTVTQLIEK